MKIFFFTDLQSESECSVDQDENDYVTESEESNISEDDLDVIREDSMYILFVYHCLDSLCFGRVMFVDHKKNSPETSQFVCRRPEIRTARLF